MSQAVRWFVIFVLGLNLAVASVLLTGGPPVPAAVDTTEPEVEPEPEDQALRRLGQILAQRKQELDKRELELVELQRGEEVLRQAGLLGGASPAAEEPAEEPLAGTPAPEPNDAFLRLQRAYENMEPDSAARALVELAKRDHEVVVELLIGWSPRTSGAILDAITQLDAGLAADLSYEVWKRSGKLAARAASSDR